MFEQGTGDRGQTCDDARRVGDRYKEVLVGGTTGGAYLGMSSKQEKKSPRYLVLEGDAVNRWLSLSAHASDVVQGDPVVWEETSMYYENLLLFAWHFHD